MYDIVAVDESKRSVDIYETDCHELCVTDTHISFYEGESYYESDSPVLLGDLEGTLVNVAAMDVDPYTVCDDISQDLGYIMRYAEDRVKVCLFYIAQFRMEDEEKGADVIRQLPTIIFKLMGRRPDLLVSYPDALPYELDEKTKEHHKNLLAYQQYRMNKVFSNMMPFGDDSTESDKQEEPDLPYGPNYRFTQDDIDYLMGSSGGYPEEAVDKKAFAFWNSVGFKEVGDSRVLLYAVRHKH